MDFETDLYFCQKLQFKFTALNVFWGAVIADYCKRNLEAVKFCSVVPEVIVVFLQLFSLVLYSVLLLLLKWYIRVTCLKNN